MVLKKEIKVLLYCGNDYAISVASVYNSVILISNKATLSKDNVIEFFNPVKYTIKDKNNKRSYEINSENAFYDINTKSVSFKSTNKRVRSKIYF